MYSTKGFYSSRDEITGAVQIPERSLNSPILHPSHSLARHPRGGTHSLACLCTGGALVVCPAADFSFLVQVSVVNVFISPWPIWITFLPKHEG